MASSADNSITQETFLSGRGLPNRHCFNHIDLVMFKNMLSGTEEDSLITLLN